MEPTSLDPLEVGLSRRLMVWAMASWFIGFFPPAMVVTIPFQLYCVYRSAKALKLRIPATAALLLLVLVPVFCVLVFLGLHQKATRILHAGGVRVGWKATDRDRDTRA